jgi:hypothetical protein
MRFKDTQTTLHFFPNIMTKETAIGMLRVAQNGNQMLEVLNTLAADSVGFTYVESPAIEQVLGVATLEPIEF